MSIVMPGPNRNLRIVVKVNTNAKGEQESVETDFVCDKGGCGKSIDVYSDGAKTVQNVVCPEHGLLTSFPSFAALQEFTALCANKILEANDHDTIGKDTKVAAINDHPDPSTVN